MAENGKPHRLRIKLPSGAELEAEGSPAFIAAERREFLDLQKPRPNAAAAASEMRTAGGTAGGRFEAAEPAWERILEIRDGGLQLRAKLRGDRSEIDACLILLAGAKTRLRTPKPTASQLARWLRASGYPITRVDRVLQASLDRGDILASGTRRARRYELSGPGAAKAFGLAFELSDFIQ